ncbi:MAG: hypothetical protein ABID38_05045 [Candidatus Diapherotrites archaeon]
MPIGRIFRTYVKSASDAVNRIRRKNLGAARKFSPGEEPETGQKKTFQKMLDEERAKLAKNMKKKGPDETGKHIDTKG